MKLAHQCAPPESLEYLFEQPPRPASVTEIVPGVAWLRMPLPFALDHINLWVLADADGWTLVDCGLATDTTRGLWGQLLAGPLAVRPPSRLLVTHCHPDHIGLAAWLCRKFELQPWMTKSEYLHAHAVYHRIAGTGFDALRPWCQRNGLDEERLGALGAREDHYRRGVPELPETFRRIKHGESFAIDGNVWRVIVGYGHSPEHAALYCETLGVLIAGDMLLPRISTNVSVWPSEPDSDPVGEFLASLALFDELPDDTRVLPSHGVPFRGIAPRVAELRRHHQTRLDKLAALCGQPRTAAQILPELFQRKLDEHQIIFALGETIAHLNYLMHRGVLERVNEDGVQRFVRRATPPDARVVIS